MNKHDYPQDCPLGSNPKAGPPGITPIRGLPSIRGIDPMRIVAWVFQTVGGIILCILAFISQKALERLDDHQDRIIKLEMKVESTMDILREIRSDLKDVKSELRHKP